MMKLRIRSGLAFLAVATLLLSCQRESPEQTVFRTMDTPFATTSTRSLLTATDIETKKTNITLAAYQNGILAACSHFTQGLDAMSLELEPGNAYSIYALVNMGDRRSDIPVNESGLSSLTYTIPSYTEGTESLAAQGLPMAGMLTWNGGSTIIPVKRLVAKVTAHLSCDWEGATITSAKVYNLNAKLKPFGTSAASGGSDVLSFQELQNGTGTSFLTATFYVPENRQGTISGISTSEGKSPDQNVTVNANRAKLTYLETTVTSTAFPYAGEIAYHSFLGNNATTDFDLERNARYDWTVTYHADRTQEHDWKRDGDIYRIVVTADKTTAYVGEAIRLTATCYRSNHGTETVTDVTSSATWSKNAGGSSSLGVSPVGLVTATTAGEASFRATYDSGGVTAYGDSPVLIFRDLPPLSAAWNAKASYIGQRGSIDISGLLDDATITEVVSSDERIAAAAAISGTSVYVNYVGAGDATLTFKASNGQTGTFTVSPASPHLLDMNGGSASNGIRDYYGHPDGTDVNTSPSGHDGLPPSLHYYTGTIVSLVTRMTVGTDPAQTVTYTGKYLAPDLYDTILKPVITVNNPLRFGCEGNTSRIWVKSLVDYPSESGVQIGTFTATPTRSDCGVSPLTERILSVNPFASLTDVTTWPDFYDKELISKYVSCESVSRTAPSPNTGFVNANASAIGWDVLLSGSPNAVMKNLFTNNSNYLWFNYEEGDALPHIGGDCEVRITVTNPYGGESLGKTFLTFKVIVCGAVGGLVSVNQTSTCTISAGYIGPMAAKPTHSVFKTHYVDGESILILKASGNRTYPATVSYDGFGHSLNTALYRVTNDNNNAIVNAFQVYRSIHSEIYWDGTLTTSPYYVIYDLAEVQDKVIHSDYHPGWIIPDSGSGPLDPLD